MTNLKKTSTFKAYVCGKDNEYYYLPCGLKMKKEHFSDAVFAVPADALDPDGELRVNGPSLSFFLKQDTNTVYLDHTSYLRHGANYLNTRKKASQPGYTDWQCVKEGSYLELKTSFFFSANPNDDNDKTPKQFLKLLSRLTGAANSRLQQPFSLVVGVRDDGSISGIENEVVDGEEHEFEAMFRNFIWQKTGSRLFSAAIKFLWEYRQGHKICALQLDPWENGLMLVNGCQLYVRQGAQTVQYLNDDLIKYIKTSC